MTVSSCAACLAGPGVSFSISEEENLITWATEGGDSYAMAFHSPSGCAQVWADLQIVLGSDMEDVLGSDREQTGNAGRHSQFGHSLSRESRK